MKPLGLIMVVFILGCVPRIPHQNHSQENITIPLAQSQNLTSRTLAESSMPEIDPSQDEGSIFAEYEVDSTGVLDSIENAQDITIGPIYLTNEQESKERFEKRLNTYYLQSSSPQITDFLVSLQENIQSQSAQCTTPECLTVFYNGMYFALDFLQYEGSLISIKTPLTLIANNLQHYASSYGNGIVLDSRRESYGESRIFSSIDMHSFSAISGMSLESVVYHNGHFFGIDNQGRGFVSQNGNNWREGKATLNVANPSNIQLGAGAGVNSFGNSFFVLFALVDKRDLYVLEYPDFYEPSSVLDYGNWRKIPIEVKSLYDVLLKGSYFIYGKKVNKEDNAPVARWWVSSNLEEDFTSLFFNHKPLNQPRELLLHKNELYVVQSYGIYGLSGVQAESSGLNLKPDKFYRFPSEGKGLYIFGASNGAVFGIMRNNGRINSLYITKDLQDWQQIPLTSIPTLEGRALGNIRDMAYANGKIFLYGQGVGLDSALVLGISDNRFHLKLFTHQAKNVALYAEPKTDMTKILTLISPQTSPYDIQILRKVGRFYEVVLYDSNTPQKGYILDIQGMPIM